MDDTNKSAMTSIHDLLTRRGFVRDWSCSESMVYSGWLDSNGLNIPITMKMDDYDFVRPPTIKIDPGFTIQERLIPHLGKNRTLCYFSPGAVVFDRYKPAGTILTCLNQAEKVIVDAIRGRSDEDFVFEFSGYWGDSFISVDLPPNFTGMAKIYYFKKQSNQGPSTFLCLDDSWLLKYNKQDKDAKFNQEDCLVVRVDKPLSIDPEQKWPPATLLELNAWLAFAAPEMVGQLEKVFASITGKRASVAIRAPNGIVCYGVNLPKSLDRVEFLRSRRRNLPLILGKFVNQMNVEKYDGKRADSEYIFQRNLGSIENLSNKKILLVGCGTIGSYVALQLAQSGAGAEGGELKLADPDKLDTANLGRHLLGVDFLYANKAEGCRKFIASQLPMLRVSSYPSDARKLFQTSLDYDLIIDATGEEGLSLSINHILVHNRPKSPTVIFGYLIGNGSVAQAILVDNDDKRACLKCLKPELNGPPRYKSLKNGIVVERITNMACGDTEYIPFPVSRSVGAAALITDLAMDWAKGKVVNRFRNMVFDPERACSIKDGNPLPSKFCPTCQAT